MLDWCWTSTAGLAELQQQQQSETSAFDNGGIFSKPAPAQQPQPLDGLLVLLAMVD